MLPVLVMVRVLFSGAALADGTSPRLRRPVSVLVEDGTLTEIYDGDDAPAQAREGTTIVDASGATIVPGFVDCHSHLTLPGGARWIARGADPTPALIDTAERNAAALVQAGELPAGRRGRGGHA